MANFSAAAAAAASTSLIQSLRFRSSRPSSSSSSSLHHLLHGCSMSFSLYLHQRKTSRQPLSVRVSSSSSEVPNEVIEDPKFVPLNADDPVYGPPTLLLLGFGKDETSKVLQLLKDLDGEFLKVIHCTEDMLSLSVWEAMHRQQPNLESVEVAKSLPRMCILSGLSGEEIMMFIDAFPEAGFEPAVFAALVPNSANKLLKEVVEEIMGDHEMMTSRKLD